MSGDDLNTALTWVIMLNLLLLNVEVYRLRRK